MSLDQMEKRESRCPEPLSEFSDLYKHRKMPCKSALNFGENSADSSVSNFIPECPTTYSNPEVMNQGTNSLVETKRLNDFSSPVGDLERTIENFRIAHELCWNTNSIFTPTNSGSLELFLYERRDSPVIDPLKSYPSLEKLGSGSGYYGKKCTNSIFQVGQKLERLSSNEIISSLNSLSEIDAGDVPLVDFDQLPQLQY
ncbi:hemolysin [Cryptosporidium felis]|nr:hemolysin [Cryptosporidium felis]